MDGEGFHGRQGETERQGDRERHGRGWRGAATVARRSWRAARSACVPTPRSRRWLPDRRSSFATAASACAARSSGDCRRNVPVRASRGGSCPGRWPTRSISPWPIWPTSRKRGAGGGEPGRLGQARPRARGHVGPDRRGARHDPSIGLGAVRTRRLTGGRDLFSPTQSDAGSGLAPLTSRMVSPTEIDPSPALVQSTSRPRSSSA